MATRSPGPQSPKTWDALPDSRSDPKSMQYPDQKIFYTPSGHCIIMDDSKGAEHLTIQHRSGTCIQFQTDGAIQLTAQNGAYEIIFGEKRMKITGSHDVVVDGCASLKVNGDYDMTVGGDLNITSHNDINFTGRSTNFNLAGNMDISALGLTAKTDGGIAFNASDGAFSATASKTAWLSGGTSTIVTGGGGVGVVAPAGLVAIEASSSVNLNGKRIDMDGPEAINFNSGTSKKVTEQAVRVSQTPNKKLPAKKKAIPT